MTLTAPERKQKTQHSSASAALSGLNRIGARLLAWYDRHRRDLPWRAPPGEPRDPFRVWVSEVMLQQTTVGTVVPYYLRFLSRFPTVERLAAADLDDVLRLWAGLGYYARGRNLHACARTVVERHGGIFPRTVAELRALPGIGDYTAAAIAAIAFDAPVVPVDGNVERVVARLFAIDEPLPGAKPMIRHTAAQLVPKKRAGDFAQALMDLGATICTPRHPACRNCPLRASCVAQGRGTPEGFPVKAAKQQGRLRRGAAFVVLRTDGAVLVRARPAKGLLGGMSEVPTTDWAHDFDEEKALAFAPMALRTHPSPRGAGEGDRLKGGAEGGTRRRSKGASSTMLRMGPLPRFTGEDECRARGRPTRQPTAAKTPLATAEIVWCRIPGTVAHVFTHFPLELVIYVTQVPASAEPPAGMRWVAPDALADEALPKLMRKVLAHAGVNGRQ